MDDRSNDFLNVYDLYHEDCVEKDLAQYIQDRGNGKYRGANPVYGTQSFRPDRFFVDKNKNYFWDFGDCRGGGVVQYLQYVRNYSKEHALKLANQEDIHYPEYYTINKDILEFFIGNLKGDNHVAKDAKEYLYQRKISDYDIEEFNIGFSGSTEDQIKFFNTLL